jgi:hypothetical protein
MVKNHQVVETHSGYDLMDLPSQHKHFAALEMRWRSQALKDAEYNLNRAHEEMLAGNYALAHGYMEEYQWDIDAAKKRLRIANHERKTAGEPPYHILSPMLTPILPPLLPLKSKPWLLGEDTFFF